VDGALASSRRFRVVTSGSIPIGRLRLMHAFLGPGSRLFRGALRPKLGTSRIVVDLVLGLMMWSTAVEDRPYLRRLWVPDIDDGSLMLKGASSGFGR
jgi:hypothetical protein